MSEQQTKEGPGIECLEVLVSKRSMENDLYWALSVYSLQNEPIRKNLFIRNTEIYHFMAFDWERSVKRLLDIHGVAYSVVQRFTVPDVCGRDVSESVPPLAEEAWLEAAKKMAYDDDVTADQVDEWLVS